jgi:hypothetical protein
MVLAENDLHVHAHFTGLADNFQDAAGGRRSTVGEPCDLHIYHRAIQLRQAESASAAARIRGRRSQFFAQRRGEFFARRNGDLVWETRVVRQNKISAGIVTEEPHHGGLFAAQDADDAAFGASVGAAALNARLHAVSVHGVGHLILADEEVTGHSGDDRGRNDETVAVAMSHQAPFHQIGVVCRRGR